MAFQEKIVSLGTVDTLLFECPVTLAGSAHGVVFSNLTSTPQPITFKHYCKSSGITQTLAQGRAVPANSEIAWPKPINLAAGDQLIGVASALNAVTTLSSIYLAASAPVSAGFSPRGEHSIIATYAVNDVVSKGGSSYIAVAPNVNDPPPSSSWMLQAEKGERGDDGADGVTPEIPASLPASDVFPWAKSESKPSYTSAEIGAQPALISGETIKTVGGVSLLGSGDIPISAANAVTLTGNLAPYVSQTTTLTITNQDSTTAYSVAATGGTASLSGDAITYAAGATAGSFAITVTAGSAERVIPITVQAASVAAPSITAPANGATNVGQTPTITTGAFSVIGATDTHLNTDYEIRTAAAGGGTLIASSLADSTNKLSWTMPASLLAVATTYYARARHRGTALGAGAWSEVSFTTAAAFTPTVPGTPYQGGFYAGRITIGGNTYAIITAPKASGHSTSKTWKTSADSTSGTLSVNDGLANSNAMNNANHPAAQFCRGLTIGGYNDWYLPSRDELEVVYRALKPTTTANNVYASRTGTLGAGNGSDSQGNGDNDNSSPAGAAYTTTDPAMTAAAAFQSGGAECFEAQYYWASTEFYATTAWRQNFSNGYQDTNFKTTAFYVRAVRKVLI